MATLSNTKIKDTYQSLVKFNDNGNITTSPKRLTDGFGNVSPFYVSTTQVGIGTSPNSSYDLHVYGNVKVGANLDVSGNLTVNGTLTYLNVTDLAVEDPLIKLAKDNDANTLDIGLFGKYAITTNVKYKGFFNDASDNKFKIFTGLTTEPTTTVDTSATGYTVGTLVANIEGNVTGDLINCVFPDDIVQLTTEQTLTNKTLTSPTITGTGAIAGTFTGNVTGDVTGNVTGNLTGNVTGNVTGNLTGDVTGGTISGTTGTFSDNVTISKTSAVNLRVTNGTQNIYVGSSGGTRFGLSTGATIIQSTGAGFGIGTQDGNNFVLGANNTAAITIDTSADVEFSGTVTAPNFILTGTDGFNLPSGGIIDWANGDARIIEGLVNNYSLSFQTYDGSAVSTALRLDGDNTATFTGNILTAGLGFSNGEGDIIDPETFGKSGIGNTFRWIEQNSGSTGSTWKKVCDIELRSGFFDGVQIDIIVYQPSTNWGETASLIKNHYVVAIRGDASDTGPTYNSALVYGKNADLLRVYKSGTYTYELQARSSNDNKDLIVEYTFTSKNNCKVTPTTSYTDGTISGGTAYTATVDANTIVKFPGNLEFNGAIFDDAEIDDLRVNGILYLGAGADSTYGGYLTNTGATAEGIKVVVDDVDGFTINAVTGNAGEQNTFFKVDDAVKLYDANGVVLETVLGGVKIPDDIKLELGDDSDLQIYHDGNHSYIDGTTTGDLYVRSTNDDLVLQGADDVFIYTQGGEDAIIARGDGAVELYHNNSKKFETTSAGVSVSGKIIAGDSGGTDGSVLLQQTYSGDDIISTIGTMYSSGGLLLGYAIAPKNGSSGFISTADNASFARSYLLLDNNEFTIGYASAQNTTVGSDITGLTTPFTLDITNGNATFVGQVITSSSSSGDYVRMYGGSGTAQWDIYGNGENLRISENSGGGGHVDIDTSLNVDSGLSAASIGVSGSNGTDGKGISLYGGANSGEPTYGMMFMQTSSYGTHGYVTQDWATYFTMNDSSNRGWIFRKVGVGNVASINNDGKATFGTPSKFYTNDSELFIEDAGTNAMQIKVGAGDELYIGSNNTYQFRGTTTGQAYINSAGYFNVTSGASNYAGIEMYQTDGSRVGFLYGDGGAGSTPSIGILDSDGNWAIRAVRDSYVELRVDNAIKLQTTASINYNYQPTWIEGGSANWNETTPGTTTGSLHLDPGSGTDNFGSAITFGASDASSGTTANAGIYTRSDGGYGTKMYFATTDSYATGSKTRMMIDYTGNIGVNTSNPLSKFVVSEGTNQHGIELAPGTLSYIQAYDRATSTYGNMTIDAKYLAFGLDNGAEKIRFTADGRVGIGTQSPDALLELEKSASGAVGPTLLLNNSAGGGGDKGNIIFASFGNTYQRAKIEFTVSSETNNPGNIDFYTGRSDLSTLTSKMTILGSGNVGIGTTSPSTPLMVNRASNSNEPGIYYDVTGGGSGSVGIGSTAAFGPFIVGNTLPNGNVRGAYPASRMLFNGAGFSFQTSDETSGARTFDDRMKIEIGGNVGIGEVSPAQKLQVGGNIRVGDVAGSGRPYIDFVRNGGAVVGGIGWHTNDVFYVGAHPSAGPTAGNSVRVYGFSNELRLGCTSYGDVMFITEGGNKARVGIGGSPSSAAGVHNFLSIKGSSHSGIMLQDTDGGAIHEMWNDGGTLNMWDSSVGYRIRFYVSGDAQAYNGWTADSIGVAGTNGTDGKGISLYSGASAGEPTYGMMFMQTGTFGTYGSVSSDYATYFTMNDNASRGWIFRRVGSGNYASISGGGDLSLSGQVVFPTNNQRIAGLNASYLQIKSGSASDGGINLVNTSGTNLMYLYASGSDAGMLNAGGYWTFKHVQGGNTDLYSGNQSHNWSFRTNGYAYFPAWINLAAGTGLFTSTSSGHFYGNNGATYGTWRTSGSRNGYSGIYDNHSGTNVNMFDSNGNGGNYKPGTGWHFYYSPGNDCLGIADSTTSSSYGAYVTGGIYSTADIVAYSDIRAKENIITVDSAIEKVNKLRGVYYTPKKGEDKSRKVGVIAQEILQVLPEVVTYDNENDQYGVDYGKITGLLIEAIKDQQKQIDKLTKFVDKLNK